MVKAVATSYEGKCPGATITVNLGGSKTGLQQVQSGAVDIFAMIVNKGAGVTNLTTDQIKGIYAGTTTNWSQVGGANIPIVVVSRPASSGTRATFSRFVIGGPEKVSGPSSLTTDSTGTVITNVAQNTGAIGYMTSPDAETIALQ